ncbi:MAG: aminotransferase class I/II-fold pyridoxal phosphate-dependent enzyme [Marinilabilia sp.]
MKSKNFSTRALHTPFTREDSNGALRMPVYDNVAFGFETAEGLEAAFRGESPGHVYSRIANPTVEHFENQMKNVTGAEGALALGSGMAALSTLIFTIAGKGNNIVTTTKLFGNTYSLFSETLPNLGIEFRFADMTLPESIEAHIDENTVALLFETITNPQMEVADAEQLSTIARKHGLILIADTTMTPPGLFHSASFGIDVEVVSSTKFIAGGATSMGGIILDNGTFDWSRNRNLASFHEKFGPMALMARLRKEVARNLGPTLSAHNAFLLSLGLETLMLRTDKACHNAMEVARWLENQPAIQHVDYPGLKSSPFFEVAQKQFNKHPGAVLTFDTGSRETCFSFMNRLEMIRRATNMNDNKSLIIHPASTIFCEFDQKTLKELDVRDTTLRLSVGIEEAEDIIEDLERGLKKQ